MQRTLCGAGFADEMNCKYIQYVLFGDTASKTCGLMNLLHVSAAG